VAGEFGAYLDEKRRGRGDGGKDVLRKEIAAAMGVTETYMSDIMKGRRYPPELKMLEQIAKLLNLNDAERAEMFDLAGRERDEAAPDLPAYLMDEKIPHVRVALRQAQQQRLGDKFWQQVVQQMQQQQQ